MGARAWIREREQIVKGMVGFLSGDPIYRSGRTGPKKMFKLNAKMLASSMDAMGGKGAIETWLGQRDEYFGEGAGEA